MIFTTRVNPNTISGFLLIDKPIGPTSHDVVATVRRALTKESGKQKYEPASPKPRGVALSSYPKQNQTKQVKVGHSGTLDPLASGLLVLGVGRATKQLAKLIGLDKTYTATVTLGATTKTDDAEGEPQPTIGAGIPTMNRVKEALKKFQGEQEQRPPIYSAKKVKGTPLYKIARQGKTVEIKPRRIKIYSLKLISYKYPELKLAIHCSSGTYIRSLARDIGQALKTGGYISELRRTAIGTYNIKEAVTMDATTDILLKELKQIRTA